MKTFELVTDFKTLSVLQVHECLFGGTKFLQIYHDTLENHSLKVGTWAPAADGVERLVTYKVKLKLPTILQSTPLGRVTETSLEEVQRQELASYECSGEHEGRRVTSVIQPVGAPWNFRQTGNFVLAALAGDKGCRVSMAFTLETVGAVPWGTRGPLEQLMVNQNRAAMEKWIQVAQSHAVAASAAALKQTLSAPAAINPPPAAITPAPAPAAPKAAPIPASIPAAATPLSPSRHPDLDTPGSPHRTRPRSISANFPIIAPGQLSPGAAPRLVPAQVALPAHPYGSGLNAMHAAAALHALGMFVLGPMLVTAGAFADTCRLATIVLASFTFFTLATGAMLEYSRRATGAPPAPAARPPFHPQVGVRAAVGSPGAARGGLLSPISSSAGAEAGGRRSLDEAAAITSPQGLEGHAGPAEMDAAEAAAAHAEAAAAEALAAEEEQAARWHPDQELLGLIHSEISLLDMQLKNHKAHSGVERLQAIVNELMHHQTPMHTPAPAAEPPAPPPPPPEPARAPETPKNKQAPPAAAPEPSTAAKAKEPAPPELPSLAKDTAGATEKRKKNAEKPPEAPEPSSAAKAKESSDGAADGAPTGLRHRAPRAPPSNPSTPAVPNGAASKPDQTPPVRDRRGSLTMKAPAEAKVRMMRNDSVDSLQEQGAAGEAAEGDAAQGGGEGEAPRPVKLYQNALFTEEEAESGEAAGEARERQDSTDSNGRPNAKQLLDDWMSAGREHLLHAEQVVSGALAQAGSVLLEDVDGGLERTGSGEGVAAHIATLSSLITGQPASPPAAARLSLPSSAPAPAPAPRPPPSPPPAEEMQASGEKGERVRERKRTKLLKALRGTARTTSKALDGDLAAAEGGEGAKDLAGPAGSGAGAEVDDRQPSQGGAGGELVDDAAGLLEPAEAPDLSLVGAAEEEWIQVNIQIGYVWTGAPDSTVEPEPYLNVYLLVGPPKAQRDPAQRGPTWDMCTGAHFGLPASEASLQTFSAVNSKLVHGYISVTTEHLCFDTVLFSGGAHKLAARLTTIQAIRRVKFAQIFNNAIEIDLADETIYFSGLLHRADCIERICMQATKLGHSITVI